MTANSSPPSDRLAKIDTTAKEIIDHLDVWNVSGSTAGAGSGDFHQYRAIRRRELERQKQMEQNAKEEAIQREFLEERQHQLELERAKTAKKAAKRKKKKQKEREKQKKRKLTHSSQPASTPTTTEDKTKPDTVETPPTNSTEHSEESSP